MYSAFPTRQKVMATLSFSLTGSFQKVTGDISDITQMAVSRCLSFWKSEYITVINASALQIFHRNISSGGRMPWHLWEG